MVNKSKYLNIISRHTIVLQSAWGEKMIEIPGYEPLVPNQIYAADGALQLTEGILPIKTALLVVRYDMPTERATMQKIQEVAKANNGGLVLPPGTEVTGNMLERAIKKLPFGVISQIATGQDGVLAFLRDNTTTSDYEGPAQRHVVVRYGLIPKQIVDAQREEYQADPRTWFGRVMHPVDEYRKRGLGEDFSIDFRVIDSQLPQYEDTAVLVKVHAPLSDFVKMRGNLTSPDLASVVDSVYDALDPSESISELTDVSSDVMLEYAVEPVIALFEELKRRQLQQAVMQGKRI